MKRRSRQWLAAVTMMLCGAGFARADGAPDEIRIGQTLPYSGALSGFGVIGRVEEAFFEKINSEGGINGRKIKFISRTTPTPRPRRSSKPASWSSRTKS